MIDNFGRLLSLRKELKSVREKIDLAFKEYEKAADDSGEKYEAEIAVMKYGKRAQEIKTQIELINQNQRIIS